MLRVDNFDKLKNVMVFKKGTYYKFVALLRLKDLVDGQPVLVEKEKQECMVRQWLVEDAEHLEKLIPDMKTVTEMFKCRLYMTADRKNVAKTMLFMRDKLNECLTHLVFNSDAPISTKMLNKLLASSSQVSESTDGDEKRWMYDVDVKCYETLKKVIEQCGEHYLETFETKNGYHVLSNKKYHATGVLAATPIDDVEVKANSLVLVAMGG